MNNSLPLRRQLHLTRLLWLLLVLSAAVSASAQALPTALRKDSLSFFGALSHVTPDYGDPTNNGFTVGADYSRHLFHFDPAIEARYIYSKGDQNSEQVFAGGLKLEKQYGRLHPYATIEIGYGIIKFQNPLATFGSLGYSQDNSIAYMGGFGLDYDVSRLFAIKVDGQAQSWKLGDANNRLTPISISAGVVYRFPAHFLRGRRY